MKKNALIIVGVADTFCGKNSPKFLKAGEKIYSDTQRLLKDNKKNYSVVLNIQQFNDSNRTVNPLQDSKTSRVLNLKLFNENPLTGVNTLHIPGSKKEDAGITISADRLDTVLSPKDYNIFICGIDIDGLFQPMIQRLIGEGYYVTVYSDIIKPFSKETITYLINTSQDKGNHLRFGKS